MAKEKKSNDFETKWAMEKLIDELFPLRKGMTVKDMYEWAFKRDGARVLLDYLTHNNRHPV